MGSANPAVDAEVMSMLIQFFTALGLQDLELQINSLGCSDCRPQYREVLRGSIKNHLDELCANCNQRYERNPLRVLDCKVERDREIAQTLPRIKDHLCQTCRDDFSTVQTLLKTIGTPYSLNDQLVRGLDYYTRTSFEVVAHQGLGSQNAICGGGRYDSLVEDFEGPPTPCFGFAIGLERLISLLPEDKIQNLGVHPDIFVLTLGEEARQESFKLAHTLRQNGWVVERELEQSTMKSQMRKANKLASRFVLIVGENEIKSGRYILKNMDGGEQVEISKDSLVEEIRPHLE